MKDAESGETVEVGHVPTFRGYSEKDLKIIAEDLNPDDPAERATIVAVEKRLAILSGS